PGAFRAEVVAPDGTVRGATAVRGDAVARAGIELLSRPDGTQVGDYVMARVDGVDVWHRIMGVRGDVAMLDHAFAARGDAAIEVHKMGLPPYALQVTFVTIAVALLITLLEVYGPRRLRRWLPSVTGFGMAWVIGCWDSVAIGIGSVIAFGIGRISPRTDERYTVSTSSGIIAGASIMSIVLIALGLLGGIGPVEQPSWWDSVRRLSRRRWLRGARRRRSVRARESGSSCAADTSSSPPTSTVTAPKPSRPASRSRGRRWRMCTRSSSPAVRRRITSCASFI